MDLLKKISGKWLALKTLATQVRYFKNWDEVFIAYRASKRLPSFELRSGITLQHGESDDSWSLFKEIFVDRCYTGSDFYTPKQEDCVIDCGANIGFFALFLESVARGIRVHCFEPASSTRAKLEKNILANQVENFVQIHPFAVSDKEGSAELAQAGLDGDTSFFKKEKSKTETVKCISLKQAVDLCGASRVDLLKIDVEGSEVEILAETDQKTWDKIDRVVLEFHEEIRPGCKDNALKVLNERIGNAKVVFEVGNGALGVIQAHRSN